VLSYWLLHPAMSVWSHIFFRFLTLCCNEWVVTCVRRYWKQSIVHSMHWGFWFNSIYQSAWQQQNNSNYDGVVNRSNSKNNNIFPFDIIRPCLLTVTTFLIVLCYHVVNSSVLWNILNSVGHSVKQKTF